MRPIDNKNTAPHTFYDQTFDAVATTRLLRIHDFSYPQRSPNKTANDPVYDFFRNGYKFNNVAKLPQRQTINLPSNGMMIIATYNMPARVINVANRDGNPNITINARIQYLHVKNDKGNFQFLRVLLPMEEAADLARLYRDDQFNGNPLTFPLHGAAGDKLAKMLYDKLSAKKTIKVNDPPGAFYGYGGAKRDLMLQLGGYCSFCETRYQDGRDLAIEHRVPKSDYWTEYLRWDNFVLGCRLCNSDSKGANPNRGFGIVNAAKAYHQGKALVRMDAQNNPNPDGNKATVGGTLLLYHEILRACNEYIQWPDVNDAVAVAPHPTNLSLRLFKYGLYEIPANGSPILINDADAVNLNNRKVAVRPNQTLEADVWDSNNTPAPGLRRRIVQVRVVRRSLPPTAGTQAFVDRKNQGADEMINLVDLNITREPTRDQRMLARTTAWFDAISSLEVLKQQLSTLEAWKNSWWPTWLGNPAPVIKLSDQQWDSACRLAEVGGFYSVWLTVYKHFGHNMAQEIAQRLDDRALLDPYSLTHYRGSSLVNSVLNQIQHIT